VVVVKRTSSRQGGAGKWNYLPPMWATVEFMARVVPVNHDAVTTMAAMLLAVVLMAYWILRA